MPSDRKLVAQQRMKEFDPKCELHKPLLIVKTVDPGCTLEVQIENSMTGEVTRLTSTEDGEADRETFHRALIEAFDAAWKLV